MPPSDPAALVLIIAQHLTINTSLPQSPIQSLSAQLINTAQAIMSSPIAFSAIEDNDYSYLYYARKNGSIAVLKSSTTQEGNDTKYTPTSVIVSGNTVSTSSTNISAVSYKDNNGNRQVRIYYISPAETGGFQLSELVQTNGGEFTQGELDNNSLACGENSLLSANVEFGKGDLKIFYQDTRGNPWVAWVVLGQTAWASHPLKPVPFKWQ
ncbi:hypothetical protein Micbo1qcDRAFT_207695 [Microdochium bolleyi]|uniref:Fucose-specific lectin n=1 Tax=Microdochium bolleyi TaxID=196109 RepID=A0A136ISF8_9PEZI|nr:hypothetical protein Micbo1qcDRAFT_207695 [Microdochium bolleyi]